MNYYLFLLSNILMLLFMMLGYIFSKKIKDRRHLLLSFSAGSILGIAIFDLIPEAIELSKNSFDFHNFALLSALGFFSYLILDRKFSVHNHGNLHETTECNHKIEKPAIKIYAFYLHALIDGLLIGMSFHLSTTSGMLITLALILHFFADGINIFNVINTSNSKPENQILYVGFYFIFPLLGSIISLFVPISPFILSITAMILSGMFFYISVVDLIPESFHKHPKFLTTLSTLIGFIFVYFIIEFTH